MLRAATLAATAATVSAGVAAASPAEDFYALPHDTVPYNGAVYRSEAVTVLDGIFGDAVRATRVMYRSTDADGTIVPTTGIVLTPTQAWTGPGQRPLVSYAIGTHGAGDACAPSRLLTETITVDGSGFPFGEYTIPDIASLVARGYTVAVTDYQGLGTPLPHPYLQPGPSGHAVLDAARAAIGIGAASPDSPVAVWGYSQGGGAAAAAAEQAAGYAPELDLRGTAVGAPPIDLVDTLTRTEGKALVGLHGYFLNGLIGTHPELEAPIEAALTDSGREFLHRTAQECTGSTAAYSGFRHTEQFTVSGEPLMVALERIPAVAQAIADMRWGDTAPDAPVLYVHNRQDDAVPYEYGEALVGKWRALGAEVTSLDADTPPLAPELGVLGHAIPMVTTSPGTVAWLTDELTA